jgi:hypothetical protein
MEEALSLINKKTAENKANRVRSNIYGASLLLGSVIPAGLINPWFLTVAVGIIPIKIVSYMRIKRNATNTDANKTKEIFEKLKAEIVISITEAVSLSGMQIDPKFYSVTHETVNDRILYEDNISIIDEKWCLKNIETILLDKISLDCLNQDNVKIRVDKVVVDIKKCTLKIYPKKMDDDMVCIIGFHNCITYDMVNNKIVS